MRKLFKQQVLETPTSATTTTAHTVSKQLFINMEDCGWCQGVHAYVCLSVYEKKTDMSLGATLDTLDLILLIL